MLIITHRKNTAKELAETPAHYGVEMDLRSHGDKLIVHHDAFAAGEDFEEWLKAYHHALLILNVKEEGLEKRLIALMAERRITGYVFLDVTPPFTLRLLRGQLTPDGKPERKIAMRLSEYEPAQGILAHNKAGLVSDWVWVDFTEEISVNPRTQTLLKEAQDLQKRGYKLCLVSPELYGPQRLTELSVQQNLLKDIGLKPEAVCTKRPDLWESF